MPQSSAFGCFSRLYLFSSSSFYFCSWSWLPTWCPLHLERRMLNPVCAGCRLRLCTNASPRGRPSLCLPHSSFWPLPPLLRVFWLVPAGLNFLCLAFPSAGPSDPLPAASHAARPYDQKYVCMYVCIRSLLSQGQAVVRIGNRKARPIRPRHLGLHPSPGPERCQSPQARSAQSRRRGHLSQGVRGPLRR
jgi:hypothetical protein